MKKHLITDIKKGSIAEELGIEVNDQLVKINDKEIEDILDYLYILSNEYLEVLIEKPSGELYIYEIDKYYDEKLGLTFENPILDCPNSCKNKCVFCFIDQLPKGMRDSLYFKDDDSRLSFFQGNYITLTNLSEEDIDKIIKLRISPINVSVHATDPEVRVNMLKNPKSADVYKHLRCLTEHDIQINGQIVLCPGYNDGEKLNQTIESLYALGTNFMNLAIVPVGITKYRKGLAPLHPVTMEKAKEVIEKVTTYQNKFLEERGSRFVFLSDEFYIQGKHELPTYEMYEGFPQLENGVGLIRKLEREINTTLDQKLASQFAGSVSIITGVSAYQFIKRMARKIEKHYPEITIHVIKIYNDFFGEKITVAGLVTGEDIIKQVEKQSLGQKVIIPNVMLKSGEDVFLDNISLEDLSHKMERKILVTDNTGEDLIRKIICEGDNDEKTNSSNCR